MSFYGLTKGTACEKTVDEAMKAEAAGTMAYYAMARIAEERGLSDVAKRFIAAANQEAVHAGFYAVLNGRVPQDFEKMLPALKQAEYDGDAQVRAIGEALKNAGLDSAATAEAVECINVFAGQEKGHGDLIQQILNEHFPELKDVPGNPADIYKILAGANE